MKVLLYRQIHAELFSLILTFLLNPPRALLLGDAHVTKPLLRVPWPHP